MRMKSLVAPALLAIALTPFLGADIAQAAKRKVAMEKFTATW